MITDNRGVLAFLSLSRTLSFTKTALELGVTQPRLSYMVRRFESDLGFDLFVRTTRRVELTEAGQQFHEAALQIEASLVAADDRVKELRGQSRSRLRIAAPSFTTRVAVRLQILTEFAAKHPRVALDVSYGKTWEKIEELRRGDVDVVFATDPYSLQGIDSLVIARSTPCVLIPKDHRLAEMEAVPLEALDGENVVCMPRKAMPEEYFARRYGPLSDAGANLVEAPEPDHFARVQYASSRGALIMSYRWQKGLDRSVGSMVTRPLVGDVMPCELHLLRRNSLHSIALEWFWAVAQSYAAPESAADQGATPALQPAMGGR